ASADLKNDRPTETTAGRPLPGGKCLATGTGLKVSLCPHCTTRRVCTLALTEPKPGELMSPIGDPNCGWLKRLNNSARKFKPIPSRGRANCLMTEKSVFTKPGPVTGMRDALPSWPGVGAGKQAGLIHWPSPWLAAYGSQPAT